MRIHGGEVQDGAVPQVHPHGPQLNLIQGELPAFRACFHVFLFSVMGFWGSQDWAVMIAKKAHAKE